MKSAYKTTANVPIFQELVFLSSCLTHLHDSFSYFACVTFYYRSQLRNSFPDSKCTNSII